MESKLGANSSGGPFHLPAGLLASFMNTVPAPVALLDRDATVIAVNAAWDRFALGIMGERSNSVGVNYLSVSEGTGDEAATMISCGLRSVLSGALSSFDHEYSCHDHKLRRWFRCLVAPLSMTENGGVAGAAVMHIDITAQKLAEERAVSASRAKSEFLASLSHELRTPLNSVIGFSEVLMMQIFGPLEERYRSYSSDIHQAGKHLLSLINEVLDLSKVEAGKFELHEESINLPEVVRGCLHLIKDRAERVELSLREDIAEPLPLLYADARLIRQILLNLLSNAVKFTPAGGTVTASVEAGADGWVRIAVKDDGIGIARHDIGRVLEPFGQVASEQSRRYQNESTGLGLPLARRFTELHGGHLILESELGHGTTITIAFPPDRVRPNP